MTARRRQSGFTLLETILVLVMVTLLLALASPSLRGWGRGAKLRSAADELVAVTGLARAQAVASARVHRLTVDADGRSYRLWVVDGSQQSPLAGEWGRPVALPLTCRLELLHSSSGVGVDFHPDGRTDPATLRITAEGFDAVSVACAAPGERFAVVRGEP